MYNKIQPEQIQIHNFSSPSGDIYFSSGSNYVYANLSRGLTGNFNVVGGLSVNGTQVGVVDSQDIVSTFTKIQNFPSGVSLGSIRETLISVGNTSSSKTLNIDSGTLLTGFLNANCAFQLPPLATGKSFSLFLKNSGTFTATFTGNGNTNVVRWAGGTAPTITATANKLDILSFVSDGSYWYGSASQNFNPY